MASTSFFSSSPTVVLPPRQMADQYFHESHYHNGHNADVLSHAPSAISTNGAASASLPPTPSEGAIAGMKRSRGDVYAPDDDHPDGPTAATQTVTSIIDRGDPTYGPGMTLVYPNDPSGHYGQDPGSQTGTWLEQRQDEASMAARRPIMPTRKSQRRCTDANSPDDIAKSLAQAVPRAPGAEPLIDEATRMLGVSWTRLDIGENNQIKQRAFSRWITRHYPFLSNIELWFENSAIPGYLGKALHSGIEEFYLWSYDLHQGILVTRQPNDLIIKLSQPHMSLSQAVDTIKADLEPVVEAAAANAAILHNDPYLIDEQQSAAAEMEVD